MKEVKLVERKPSDRLSELVDAIPELKISGGCVCFKDVCGTYSPIYTILGGCIDSRYNKDLIHYNPLRNSKKLLIANDSFKHITEESFCYLLEEHLYLVAKEKMAELLPQIQEHYPTAYIIENESLILITTGTTYICNILFYSKHSYKFVLDNKEAYDHIWEDKENLIVKKPKPWWESQTYFYRIFIDNSIAPYEMAMIRCDMSTHSINNVGKNAGKTTFKNKQEAQAMCDKLNAVLKGEQ